MLLLFCVTNSSGTNLDSFSCPKGECLDGTSQYRSSNVSALSRSIRLSSSISSQTRRKYIDPQDGVNAGFGSNEYPTWISLPEIKKPHGLNPTGLVFNNELLTALISHYWTLQF